MNRDAESEKVHFFVNTVKAAGSVIMPYVSVNPEKELLQTKLKELAEEISEDLSALEAEQGKELLSDFVSDLFLAAAKRRQQQERRRRQAEGIAAAKARGVRFGRAGMPAPENFDRLHQAWRNGEMSLQQAANACGISKGTFHGMAVRKEKAESCAG